MSYKCGMNASVTNVYCDLTFFFRHSMEPSEKVSHDEVENDLDELDDDKKKKKKKRVTKRFQEVFRNDVPEFEEDLGAGHYAPASEGYGRSLAVGKL